MCDNIEVYQEIINPLNNLVSGFNSNRLGRSRTMAISFAGAAVPNTSSLALFSTENDKFVDFQIVIHDDRLPRLFLILLRFFYLSLSNR